MPRTIRFHLDENVPSAIGVALRVRGIDVTTSADAGLDAAADLEHYSFGREEGRGVFTFDSDFVGLHHSGASRPHGGVIFCSARSQLSLGEVIRGLVAVWEISDPREFQDILFHLTRDFVRGL